MSDICMVVLTVGQIILTVFLCPDRSPRFPDIMSRYLNCVPGCLGSLSNDTSKILNITLNISSSGLQEINFFEERMWISTYP